MTKEEKVQLKYVERLAKDSPIYFDERQMFFFSALDVIKGKMKGTSVISMGGFPAGQVTSSTEVVRRNAIANMSPWLTSTPPGDKSTDTVNAPEPVIADTGTVAS